MGSNGEQDAWTDPSVGLSYLLPVQRLEVREHELPEGILDELPFLKHRCLQPAKRERERDAVVVRAVCASDWAIQLTVT